VPEHERRRHMRYPLRMTIKLRRGSQELSADILNASVGGCLLLLTVPLEKGEALDVSIPMLNLSQARLFVLRCDPTPEGYQVATSFDELATESEDFIREASEEQQAGSKTPVGR
jgi:PilZ domain-containing protein